LASHRQIDAEPDPAITSMRMPGSSDHFDEDAYLDPDLLGMRIRIRNTGWQTHKVI